MSESLAVTKLMQEADEAIVQCRLCKQRGHEMGVCPLLEDWLRIRARRIHRPGIKRRRC